MKSAEQIIIDEIRGEVWDGEIKNITELEKRCRVRHLDIFDDILSPMGWNACDRCGELYDSELGLIWLDQFPFEEDNPNDQALLKAIAGETDYCAVCDSCCNGLIEMGKKLLTKA